MLTKDQVKEGVKVKIPTRDTSTFGKFLASDLGEFNEEIKKKKYTLPYLILTGGTWEDGDTGVTFDGELKHQLNSNVFHLRDLELYEEEPVETTSAINPSHYQANGVQVMDQMIAVFGVEKVKAFCEVNAFKYRMRAGKKTGNPPEQDIEKALWYENKLKELTPTEASFDCLGEL